MKATRRLQKQQDGIEELFRHLRKGTGDIGELVQQLASRLVAHLLVEEELFYPAALGDVEERRASHDKLSRREERVLELREDNAVMRYMLDRLVSTAPIDRTFTPKLMTLQRFVFAHFEAAEGGLFPKVEKALGDGSTILSGHIHALFERTRKRGYTIATPTSPNTSARRHANGERRAPMDA